MLAGNSGIPELAHFQLQDYDERLGQSKPELPPGLRCWQNWEYNTAYFRILKSKLLSGKDLPLSQLHAGALLSEEAESVKVKIKELKLAVASQQTSTKRRSDIFFFFISNYCFFFFKKNRISSCKVKNDKT
jgi:hypothetical protein